MLVLTNVTYDYGFERLFREGLFLFGINLDKISIFCLIWICHEID